MPRVWSIRTSAISKGDVAAYYAAVAWWMLPELADWPLSLLRARRCGGRPR